MNPKQQLFFSICMVTAALAFTGESSTAQTVPGQPQRPQTDPSSPREMQPTIPGQTAPTGPGKMDQLLPGQQGTIPERIQPPDAGGERDRTAGISAEEIRRAKEALKAKGHNPGTMDGNIDSEMQHALREFQRANKLPLTGTLDPQTARELGVVVGHGPANRPNSDEPPAAPRRDDSIGSGKAR